MLVQTKTLSQQAPRPVAHYRPPQLSRCYHSQTRMRFSRQPVPIRNQATMAQPVPFFPHARKIPPLLDPRSAAEGPALSGLTLHPVARQSWLAIKMNHEINGTREHRSVDMCSRYFAARIAVAKAQTGVKRLRPTRRRL